MNYKCLSIAGFDGSGGAGIQADLKTFSALGCYGMTVLTALPVQNTCGVKSCYSIPLSCIEEQLHTIFEDIIPDAIKIGMLFSIENIELIADFLQKNAAGIPIVLDPVMMAKSGDPLLQEDAIVSLKNKLFPLATLVTPNLPEAKTLVGENTDPYQLAAELLQLGCQAVLLKGGHADTRTADDLFLSHHERKILSSMRIDTKNTHGTGCTLSADISSFLAKNYSLVESCERGKQYLLHALQAAKDIELGKGQGPVHHFHEWEAEYT